MNFGTALIFCHVVVTPIVFGILAAGWFGMIPELEDLSQAAVKGLDSFIAVDKSSGTPIQVGLLAAISFVYAFGLSIPLSWMFSSK